ncbi:metallophosphoesterase family protein [Sphingobacterium corticibacter]|uniref:YfcE family phosphodiesterase n=1 Tax=Sphingobacterium corticibacter TaxID=2171749 RepID=A0A2T8HGW3_9SPHI|nr:metallophosphoesterase family protein [Sphingobacterium corticibacter]PVH24687.1 YfcE family phosphodiesterase [Sphingobacterium corticibacter]
MKIAFFSDIHANLLAFEAMLKDLDGQRPDAAYCLGDLVGYHIYPNEVIEEIRRRSIATLKGNHDKKVESITTTPESLKEKGSNYAYHLITEDNRNYLKELPTLINLAFTFGEATFKIALAHGSTRRIDEYILIDTDENYVLELLDEADADILIVGHSHKPYHRTIETKSGVFKHVINLGSVGKPKDGDLRGCYALLTIDNNNSLLRRNSININFRRIVYDVEASAKDIEESPLPAEFAVAIRSGK